MRVWAIVSWVALAGCSGAVTATVHEPAADLDGGGAPGKVGGFTVNPAADGGSTPGPADAGPPTWQAAFHAAIRFSETAAEFDTFAMRVQLARTGTQVRAGLRAGDGTMQVGRVFIAHVDGSGHVGAMTQLPTPDGGLSASHHGFVTTDAAAFDAHAGDEVEVSFEAQGDIAASTIDLFPGSTYAWGLRADDPTVLATGTPHAYLAGLAELDVFGPSGHAAIGIGDSITEGYIRGTDDIRNAWTSVASSQLGWPVVNAGVSGQGIWEEDQALSDEVLRASGITDCVVLLGTNDLGAVSVNDIEHRLQAMWGRLAPFCAVHAATLLPKEQCGACDYNQIKADRAAVNAFIRANGPNLIDAEAAMRDPSSPDKYAPGLGEDGIHPSVAGQKVLGQAIATALAR